MKFKQIAIASSLFFSCHLVATGATYDRADVQGINFSDPFGHAPALGNESDSLLFEPKLSAAEAKEEQLKQEYLGIINLLKNKKLDAAENKIKLLIQEKPNISAFYSLQGLVASSKKANRLAIYSFNKSIELAPKNPSPHLGLAAIYLGTGELSLAKKHTNSALSINDASIHAYILLAKIAYQENKLHKIEEILLTAQEKAHGDSHQEIVVADNLAKLYVIQKNPKKALVIAQGIISRYPDDNLALALLANAQIFNDKTTQAIPTLEKLIEQDNQDTQHRLLLAKLLLKHPQNKRQVLRLLDEIEAIDPKSTQAQVQRTILLIQLSQYPKALQATKKVKQLAPDTGLAEALEGKIYLAEKKQDLALPAFLKSYKLKPNNELLGVIVKVMIAQSKQQDAINLLNQALKKSPKNLVAHFNLGNIYQQQNNNQKAEKHYQVILSKQPNNVVILNNLAWIYHLENNPKALILAKKAYQNAPKSAAAADTYAVILVKEGALAQGLKIFQHAGKLAPTNYDIQYHLANAYTANNQSRQAINILKQITRSKQGFSEKDSAIQLLNRLQ